MDWDPLRSATPESDRRGRGADGARPADPASRLASAVGNRGLARTIAGMHDGEGILPNGVVHPDVDAAIVAASGGGRRLDPAVAEQVGRAYGESLSDVRVHHDAHAAELARAVSARAFTVGRDIFFASGQYAPGATDGRALLAHELAHVVQQRGAARAGPLAVSQPGDALERDADDAARGLN